MRLSKKQIKALERATNNAMESPEFYEELLLLRAQEIVSELMEERGINKAQLAKKLGTSKAYVTGMLSTGRNLTLKTLARVCYNLSAEAVLDRKDIGLIDGRHQMTPAKELEK